MASRRSKKDEHPSVTFILEKIGKQLVKLRKERGIANYEKFANELNISRAQIGRYEKGEDLKMSTIVMIAMALNMPLNEFFSEFDSFKPDTPDLNTGSGPR